MYGDTVDLNINYMGLYDSGDTRLLWVAVNGRSKPATGELGTVFNALDSDGAMSIATVKYFAGATSTPETGTCVSIVPWAKAKTANVTIQFQRKDIIVKG